MAKTSMLKSYFLLALRHVVRSKVTAIINVFSLAIGIAVMLMVIMFVRYELTYDTWLADSDRVFRVDTEFSAPGQSTMLLPYIFYGAKATMMDRYPEIEAMTNVNVGEHSLHMNNEVFYEYVNFADEDFLGIFSLEFVEGAKDTAFNDASAIIISERKAKKYFGDTSPLGKIIEIEQNQGGGVTRGFTVTGVFKNLPVSSHLNYMNIIARNPLDTNQFGVSADHPWAGLNVYGYMRLKEGADENNIRRDLANWTDAFVPRVDFMGEEQISTIVKPILRQVSDIHMIEDYQVREEGTGNWNTIYVVSSIGALVLLLASFNFMNLALAQSMKRAKEISIRKVHGASRSQLIIQYLGETLMMVLVSLVIGIALVELLLSPLNAFIERDLQISMLMGSDMLLWMSGLVVVITLMAGLYPAFVLSATRPARIFRDSVGSSKSNKLRTFLIIVQFAVSVALGIGAAVIQNQRHYSTTSQLGFDVNNKVVIRWMSWGHFAEKADLISERIKALPIVEGAAFSDAVPGDVLGRLNDMNRLGAPADTPVPTQLFIADGDFFDVYGVELLAGRFLSEEYGQDMAPEGQPGEGEIWNPSIVINETAVRKFGFGNAESALGQAIQLAQDGVGQQIQPIVVGVVKDFQFGSSRTKIHATAYYMYKPQFNNLTVSFKPGVNMAAAVEDVTAVWKDHLAKDPITLDFLDLNVAKLYEQDRRQGILVSALAGLALFVACIGLYGLAALTAKDKAKEISIRKVYGASTATIISLMMWRFSRPVLWALFVAWPLAWYGANRYLESFAYRTELGIGYFATAGVVAILIACIAVGGHAIKVSATHPAVALKHE